MSATLEACDGVVISFAEGRLKVRARRSAVPPDQLDAMRRHKAALLPILATFGTAMVVVRPATLPPELPPPSDPPAPRWRDLDALRAAYGEARGLEAKRDVVAAWAVAAGGKVEDGTLLLPADLPNTLTLATLKTCARCAGLTVGELTCAWCPNSPLEGDALCDHCRWIAGESR
jgi:hypothetical protein